MPESPPAVPLSQEEREVLRMEADYTCRHESPVTLRFAAAQDVLRYEASLSEAEARVEALERDADEMSENDALQVICRVFDDGADQGWEEYLAWYKPSDWLHRARGLGAFIRMRLDRQSASRSSASITPKGD